MASLQFLVLLTVCTGAFAKDCVVANFKFKQDFDMNRYPAFMYHQLSLFGSGPKDGVTFITRVRDDTVVARVSARNSTTGVCEDTIFVMRNEKIGSPKLRITTITESEPSTLTYYVASTDYKNYWMLYNCFILDTDGSCKLGNFFVNSIKSSKLRKKDKRRAEDLAKKYCLDPTQFVNLREQKVCPLAKELRAQYKAGK